MLVFYRGADFAPLYRAAPSMPSRFRSCRGRRRGARPIRRVPRQRQRDVPEFSHGTNSIYRASEYDCREVEAQLTALPHFITEIDGLDIHYIHVRSKHEDALPLLVTHGWPGSVIEQLKMIEPLADPAAHGGDASDAFHWVVPSMPGYGFSGKPSEPGWNPERMARARGEPMKRLGYEVCGPRGRLGRDRHRHHGVQEPEGLIGIHTDMANAVPPAVMAAVEGGDPVPDDVSLSPEEKEAVEQLRSAYADVPYAYQMGTAPRRSPDWSTRRSASPRSCSTTTGRAWR